MNRKTVSLHIGLPVALLLLFFWTTAVGSVRAAAQEPAAMVVAIRGEAAAITPAGVSRKLAIKDPIFQKEIIKTGGRSRLQIMFNDNTIISLGSSSELKVVEHDWNAANQEGRLTTEVKEGAFRVMGGIISKKSPEKLQTRTPAATIGIRGSMYSGSVRGGELSVVFEGGRGISLQNSTGLVLISRPGFGSRVPDWNTPIQSPQKYTTRDFLKVHHEVNPKTMLKKVLQNMKNPSRTEFNAIINEAVDHDLSPAEAKEAVEELKADPEAVCK
jgi:hypothetical protein